MNRSVLTLYRIPCLSLWVSPYVFVCFVFVWYHLFVAMSTFVLCLCHINCFSLCASLIYSISLSLWVHSFGVSFISFVRPYDNVWNISLHIIETIGWYETDHKADVIIGTTSIWYETDAKQTDKETYLCFLSLVCLYEYICYASRIVSMNTSFLYVCLLSST